MPASQQDYLATVKARLPSADEWSTKLQGLGFDHGNARSASICEVLHEDDTACDRDTVQEVPDLLHVFKALAASDARIHRTLEIRRAQADLYTIVTLSVCRVLEKRGISYEALDVHIHHIATNYNQRRAVYLGVCRLHDAARSLIIRGWHERKVAELVGIICPSASALAALSSNSWREIVDTLQERNPNNNAYDLECCSFPFTLPELIERFCHGYEVANGKLTLDEICHALGYMEKDDPLAVENGRRANQTSKRARCNIKSRDSTAQRPNKRQKTTMLRNPGTFRQFGVTTSPQAELICNPSVGAQQHAAVTERTDMECDSLTSTSAFAYQQHVPAVCALFAVPRDIVLSREQLFLGLRPQARWDECGDVKFSPIADAGLDEPSVQLFQEKTTLEAILEYCEAERILECVGVGSDRPSYRAGSQMPISAGEEPHNVNGLAFLCHVCPRDGFIDRDSIAVARALLPPLHTWFEYLRGKTVPPPPSGLIQSIIDTSVVMCSIGTLVDARLALHIARKLCTAAVPMSTRLSLDKAESVYERLSGLERLSQSDEIAIGAITAAEAEVEVDACSKYAHAQLHFSLAENSLLRNDLRLAHIHVGRVDWLPKPDEQWPVLMLRLVHTKSSVLGRILRYKGDFVQAREVLEECLLIGKGARMLNEDNIRRHLADVYCELGETERTLDLLRPRLDEMERDGKEDSRAYRRLILPYADACADARDSQTALQLWRKVSDHFERQPATNSTDELDHLRVQISLIRLYRETEPPEKLFSLFTDALGLIDRYPSFTQPNYYRGLLLQARARICESLARSDCEVAAACDVGPRHFIALMGTRGREALRI